MIEKGAATTEVKLLGQRIVLKSSENDPEVVRQVLQLVTVKLEEAEKRSRGAAPHQVALVALLDLAEEYIKAKQRTNEYKQQLDEKSSKLLSLIEAGLSESGESKSNPPKNLEPAQEAHI